MADGILSLLPIPIRKCIGRGIINNFSERTGYRPSPYSMHAEYTTWEGLRNKTWYKRHLGYEYDVKGKGKKSTTEYVSELPSVEDVGELFRRDKYAPAPNTSMLLPLFAQWFTDSFLRTKFGEPEKNESNHDIDLNQIYGMDESKSNMLRSKHCGHLRSQFIAGEEYPDYLFERREGGLELKPEYEGLYTEQNYNRVFGRLSDEQKEKCFAVGLEHGNSTFGNVLFNVLFLREHNRIADILLKKNPSWDDERCFQTARNINIVLLLKLVIEDYVSHISGFPLSFDPGAFESERWYRDGWMTVEFSLLYRWKVFLTRLKLLF